MPTNDGLFTPCLSDYSFGELSPKMLGRTESEVYHKGAQTMQNFVPMIQGGFRKRVGTLQLGTIYNNNPIARLKKVVVSGSSWYLLEFSAASSSATATLRIWGNMNTTPSVVQTISTAYLGSELNALQFGWAYPDLFIAHANHPPAYLEYVSSNVFALVTNIPIVGSAAQYLVGVTLTYSENYFTLPSAYPLASLSNNIMQTLTITAYSYTSPYTTFTISSNPLNSFWSFVGKNVYINDIIYVVVGVSSNTIIVSGNVAYTGVAYVSNTGAPVTAIYNGAPCLPNNTYLSFISPFAVVLNTPVTATPGGACVVAISFDITTSPSTGYNTVPDLPFQSYGNYPAVVSCANQRVLWGSSLNNPQMIWASVVGIWDSYGNMEMQFFELTTYTTQQISTNAAGQPLDSSGNVVTSAAQNTPAYISVPYTSETIGDADGYNGEIYSDQNDAVQWIVSMVDIIMGTLSGQVEIDGTSTANTYAFTNICRTGCAAIQGFFMTGGCCFVDRAGKRVLLLNWQGKSIVCPPPQTLSIFSSHLFEQDPITQITYGSSPVMRLWFLRASGTVVCCEFDDQYGTRAWWRLVTGYNGSNDSILSIETGPGTNEDFEYLAVQRGTFVTLEQVQSPYWNAAYYSGLYNSTLVMPPVFLDCAVMKQNLTAFSTVSVTDCPLLANLAGRTIALWGDGAYLGTVNYVSGTITVPVLGSKTTYNTVIIGLPYTSIMTTMPFTERNVEDSKRGDIQTNPRVAVSFLNSLDGYLATLNSNGQYIYSQAQVVNNQKAFPSLFTGTERDPINSGFGFDTAISIKSTVPLPLTVTAIMPQVGDNERS